VAPSRFSSKPSAANDFTVRTLTSASWKREATSARTENWSVARRRTGPRMPRVTA
jgi:hypothetical protein